MSEKNRKVCCNCRHNMRCVDDKFDIVYCRCDIHEAYMSYEQVMSGWCRHWAKEKEEKDD